MLVTYITSDLQDPCVDGVWSEGRPSVHLLVYSRVLDPLVAMWQALLFLNSEHTYRHIHIYSLAVFEITGTLYDQRT